MNVLLVNGSPNANGCTYTALRQVADALNEAGVETTFLHIGKAPVSGCTACGACYKTKRCVVNDVVNEFHTLAEKADGFVFGSPVYYASANGSFISFMDRAFYSGDKKLFYLKPAACVTSARRAGTTATLEQMQKYLTISQMPVISSQYWCMVHGFTPEDVKKDLEGMQTMRVLGRNMAYFLQCKKAGEDAGVPLPRLEKRATTNFISD